VVPANDNCASCLDGKEQGTWGKACTHYLGGPPSNETEVQEVQMEINQAKNDTASSAAAALSSLPPHIVFNLALRSSAEQEDCYDAVETVDDDAVETVRERQDPTIARTSAPESQPQLFSASSLIERFDPWMSPTIVHRKQQLEPLTPEASPQLSAVDGPLADYKVDCDPFPARIEINGKRSTRPVTPTAQADTATQTSVPDLKPTSGSGDDVNVEHAEQGPAQVMPLHQKHPPPTPSLQVQKGHQKRHKEVQTDAIESWDEAQKKFGNVVNGPKTVSGCDINSPQEEQELKEDWSEDQRQEEFTAMIQRLREMDAMVSHLASANAIDPACNLLQPTSHSSSAGTLPPQLPPPDIDSGDGNDVGQRTEKGGANGFHQARALDPPLSARASPSESPPDHPTAPEVTRENRNVENRNVEAFVLGLNRTTNSTSLFTPITPPTTPPGSPLSSAAASWVHTVSGEDAGDIDDMNKLVKKLINCLKSGNGGPGRGGGGSSKALEGPLTLDKGSPNSTQSSSVSKKSSVAQNDCPPPATPSLFERKLVSNEVQTHTHTHTHTHTNTNTHTHTLTI